MKKQPSDINQLHQEQLTYIGQRLRDARESQSLSLEALAKTTLIRSGVLQAIEMADVEQLPEPVYTRGLIRRYGDRLGLDGEALASQYFTPPQQKQAMRSFWRVPITPQLRPVHLYAFYVMLIAIAISALSYTLKQTTYRTNTLPVLEGEAAEEAMMPEEGIPGTDLNPQSPDGAPVAPGVADAPVRVTVKMRDQSWLRITVDGQVTFEGILKQGDAKVWTAEERLRIRAGNAGGVVVSFNEGDERVLGQPGMVTEVTYPPESTARLTVQ